MLIKSEGKAISGAIWVQIGHGQIYPAVPVFLLDLYSDMDFPSVTKGIFVLTGNGDISAAISGITPHHTSATPFDEGSVRARCEAKKIWR